MLSIIDSQGVERFLGNIEPPAGHLCRAFPVYGDTADAPMFARSEWSKYAITDPSKLSFLPPVADQNGIGMCNASATCTAIEAQRRKQGLPHVQLSGGDLYGRINGGSDRGSLLEDGLEASMKDGVASVATCPYLDWRKRTSEQASERKRYRVLEAFLCPTFDHCASAVIAGFSLISGIMWYDNYEPGSDGWLPKPRGQAGGHAVYGFALAMRGNEAGIWHQNSWQERWGLKGCCVFPEGAYKGQVGGWWAVRSVTDEGGIVPQEN